MYPCMPPRGIHGNVVRAEVGWPGGSVAEASGMGLLRGLVRGVAAARDALVGTPHVARAVAPALRDCRGIPDWSGTAWRSARRSAHARGDRVRRVPGADATAPGREREPREPNGR